MMTEADTQSGSAEHIIGQGIEQTYLDLETGSIDGYRLDLRHNPGRANREARLAAHAIEQIHNVCHTLAAQIGAESDQPPDVDCPRDQPITPWSRVGAYTDLRWWPGTLRLPDSEDLMISLTDGNPDTRRLTGSALRMQPTRYMMQLDRLNLAAADTDVGSHHLTASRSTRRAGSCGRRIERNS